MFIKGYLKGFVPNFFEHLRNYSVSKFKKDIIAGITVAIVALPLSMALGIASGVSPAQGLYTAIVAGFFVSFLGGSDFQIGGPTGAFAIIVFNIMQNFGFAGLALATFMAGILLIIFGFFKLGKIIGYIPHPVITGFTSGIALVIFSGQVKDFFGLSIENLPSEFIEKWHAIFVNFSTINYAAFLIGALTLALIILIKKFKPNLPYYLIAIFISSVIAFVLKNNYGINIETIESKFGALPSSLPAPSIPEINFKDISLLFPSALVIAFLASIESLLSAVVADNMANTKHKPNCELVGQGFANIASVLFGGICATGAIARTAVNIKAEAKSPMAGIFHACFILLFMMFFAKTLGYIPLCSLSAVLFVVAYNMAQLHEIRYVASSCKTDTFVLVTTFLLTVLVDLPFAISIGVALACLMFIKRLADVAEIEVLDTTSIKNIVAQSQRLSHIEYVDDVKIISIHGPFFFGISSLFDRTFISLDENIKAVIINFTHIQAIDSTGALMFEKLIKICLDKNIEIYVSGIKKQPMKLIKKLKLDKKIGETHLVTSISDALLAVKPKV